MANTGWIEIVPGATNDPEAIRRAVSGCDGVLVVLVPWGMQHYASGTAQAVLDHAPAGARLVFSRSRSAMKPLDVDLSGRVALVTGANSGMDKETARELALT